MASLKADVERIVRLLERDHGCEVKLTNRGHWRVTRPGYQPVTMSRTPSDQRVIKNIRGDVAKYLGVQL